MAKSSPSRTKLAEQSDATTPDVGRFFRAVAGVEDELMRTYRGERARYTSLGAVVLGTAGLAAFSMAIAITEIFDEFSPWQLLPAAGWGLFILSFDRWLVSTTPEGRLGSLALFLPRLLMAGALGVVVAVPLVLKVFDVAIVEHVRSERLELLADSEALLIECNPQIDLEMLVAGRSQTPAEAERCSEHTINLTSAVEQEAAGDEDGPRPSDPAALVATRSTLRERRTQLAGQLRPLESQIDDARRLMVAECNGDPSPIPGQETTGIDAQGPECQRRVNESLALREAEGYTSLVTTLDGVDDRILELDEEILEAVDSHNARIGAEIQRRGEEERSLADDPSTEAPADGPIGFGERIDALFDLGEQSQTINYAHWSLTGFLILVDVAPVLVKMLSTRSGYDHLVKAERHAVIDRVGGETTSGRSGEATGMRPPPPPSPNGVGPDPAPRPDSAARPAPGTAAPQPGGAGEPIPPAGQVRLGPLRPSAPNRGVST